MTVVISSDGMLGSMGSVGSRAAVQRSIPSYAERFRRPQVSFFHAGWDRHVEEVNGRAPSHGPAQLCDMPGSPPCDSGSVQAGLAGPDFGGFGALGRITNVACSDHTTELERLDDLVAEATRAGVTSSALQQVQTYLGRFEGFLSGARHPVLPGTCTKEVAMARALYKALNAEVKAQGGMPGVEEPPAEGSGLSTISGTIKTVAIAAAIVAGVVAVVVIAGPIVKEVIFVRRATGRGTGGSK